MEAITTSQLGYIEHNIQTENREINPDFQFKQACIKKNYKLLKELKTTNIQYETINECLFEALIQNEDDLVEFLLLNEIADANALAPNKKNSILHIACRKGNVRVANILLSKGANCEAKGLDHSTPLMQAIYNGSMEIVELLIKHTKNISSENLVKVCFDAQNPKALRLLVQIAPSLINHLKKLNISLYMFLCHYPHTHTTYDFQCAPMTIGPESRKELLDILEENDIKLDPSSEEHLQILAAPCLVDYDDVLEYFLTNQIKPCSLSHDTIQLLFHATLEKGSNKCLQKLIELGMDVNFQDTVGNNTPLHIACIEENYEAIRLLLKAKADTEALNGMNLTPLMGAVIDGSVEIARMLIEGHADITSTKLARDAFITQNPQMLELLLDHGAPLETSDKDSMGIAFLIELFCIFTIIKRQQSEMCVYTDATISADSRKKIINILTERGKLDFSNTFHSQFDLFVFLCASNHEDLFEYLPTTMLDFSTISTEQASSLFTYAIQYKSYAVLEKLINLRLDVNCISVDHSTPLHMACSHGDTVAINLLLQANVKKNVVDTNNTSPLHIALSHVHDKDIITKFITDESVIESFKIKPDLMSAATIDNLQLLMDSPIFDKSPLAFILALAVKHVPENQKEQHRQIFFSALKRYPEYKNNLAENQLFKLLIISGNYELTKELLAEGHDLPVGDQYAANPLHWACASGNIELCQWLLKEKSYSINTTDAKGNTLLHFALQNGDMDNIPNLIDWLISHGFDLYATNSYRKNVFEEAICSHPDEKILKKLIEHDKEKRFLRIGQKNGRSAIHYAAKHRSLSTLKFLIEDCQADINVQDASGKTPLMLVVRDAVPEEPLTNTIQLFLDRNVDLILKDIHGKNILHYLFRKEPHEVGSQLLLLEKCQDLILEKDANETTPLHFACREHDLEMITRLFELSNVSDISTLTNKDGKNLLHFAVENEDPDLFDFLIEKGFDFRKESVTGEMPIHIAIQYKHADIVLALLDLGCDPTTTLKNGTTCLDLAMKNNLEELYSPLIEKGALLFQSNVVRTLPCIYWEQYIPKQIQQLFLQKAIKTLDADTTYFQTEDNDALLDKITMEPELLLKHLPLDKVLAFLWYAQNPVLSSKVIPLLNMNDFAEAFLKLSEDIPLESLRDFFIFDEVDPTHLAIEVASKNIPEWTDTSVTIEDLKAILEDLNFDDINHPNYIKPSLLNFNGETHTAKDLKAYFLNTFIDCIANEKEFEMTGPKGSPEIKQFYRMLKNKVFPIIAKLKCLGTSEEDKEMKMKILLTILPEISRCGPKWQNITEKVYMEFCLNQTIGYRLSVLQLLYKQRDSIVEAMVDPTYQHNVHEAIAIKKAFGKELGLQSQDFADEIADGIKLKRRTILQKFFKGYTVDDIIDICYLEAKDKADNTYNEIVDVLFQTPAGYMQIPEGIDDEIAYMMSVWQEESLEPVSSLIDKKRVFFRRETIAKVLEQYNIIRRIRPRE